MDYKEGVKELVNQFNANLTFDIRKGEFELVEATGLISSVAMDELTFAIKAEVVFHSGKDNPHLVITNRAEFPIKDTGNFLEQLLYFQESFYKSFYTDLVRFTLFAKESTLRHSNGEPYKIIPISKLILGEDEK